MQLGGPCSFPWEREWWCRAEWSSSDVKWLDSGYIFKVELTETINWLDLGKEKRNQGWFPGFYLSNYTKAGVVCCSRLGFVLDVLSLKCLLDIQMERSVKMMDRSLEDEGNSHAVEEYFGVTRGLCKLLRKYLNCYIPGEEERISLWNVCAMFLCTPSPTHSLYTVSVKVLLLVTYNRNWLWIAKAKIK